MRLLLFCIMIIIMTACQRNMSPVPNPFFESYQTPFSVPPFDQIKNEHFIPAIKEGIRQHQKETERIKSNPEPPSFENTIMALDCSGMLLKRVQSVFYNFNSANTSEEIQSIAREISPLLSEHLNNTSMDTPLFSRVRSVYQRKEELNLSEEQSMLLDEFYRDFINNGAALSEEQQERFREINKQLSLLKLQFQENVLSDVNNFSLIIEDSSDLAGLPEAVIDIAAKKAKEEDMEGKWIFTLHNSSVMPFLMYAKNRALREKMNRAYILRGNNTNQFNNGEIINQIIALRLERANMLGYKHYAEYALENRMAHNVENVMSFLEELWDSALLIVKNEMRELQNIVYQEGEKFDLQYWDWLYYAEKLRKEKYDINEEALRPYFELNNVRNGIFLIVDKLWGLQFIQREDVPVYHPDVTAWEVLERDGKHLGIIYMDMHPRENKRGGAWMSNFRRQYVDPDKGFISPVISIVCNFTPPGKEQPSLLSFEEMTTFFHEFGHALHSLMSKTESYSLSGTSVPRDFVELPSQIMENWAKHPEVLPLFAKHYETGEPIPDELIEKLKQTEYFNQGFSTVEFLSSALLDMDYHTSVSKDIFDVNEFEQKVQDHYNMPDEIYFRHGSTHFQHIFSGGYAAGYYSYIWAGILDADAFEAFVETGDLYDQETARKFRTEILERGGTRDAMKMYKAFRGREPGIEPLLKQRGLMH